MGGLEQTTLAGTSNASIWPAAHGRILAVLHLAMLAGMLALFSASVPLQAQMIVNIAEASWRQGDAERSVSSNAVETEVELAEIELQVLARASNGAEIMYRDAYCGSGEGGPGDAQPMTTQEIEAQPVGSDLIFALNAASANIDPTGIDTLVVEISSESGDKETLTVYENEQNSGIFVGQIPTRRMFGNSVIGDCMVSLTAEDRINIAVLSLVDEASVFDQWIEALADPFGMLFDSRDGQPVSGARVSLVDANSGALAQVFAEDGLTSWPSTVVSGEPIVDGAGTVYPMEQGRYWFPLAALGSYRLVVEPPEPYSAPSTLSPAQLAPLRRDDGGAFVISDASYGQPFELLDETPVEVDIPLDRPITAFSVTKSVSKSLAQPGDALVYTIEVRNTDANAVLREVTLTESAPSSLRLRLGTVLLDGVDAAQAVIPAPDGSGFTLTIGELAPGETVRTTYAMTVRPNAAPGNAESRSRVVELSGTSGEASANVRIERDNLTSRMTLIGRVTAGPCGLAEDRIGIPGVLVMLQDGSYAVTDGEGRYHFDGLVPGSHVVQVQRASLPDGGEFVDCTRSTRSAGSAISRFVQGQGGSLLRADFHAELSQQALASLTRPPAEPQAEQIEPQAQPEDLAQDYLMLGDGPDGWLVPALDANPRVPAVQVAIRHRAGQTVTLLSGGEEVEPLLFEGVVSPPGADWAISHWRAVPLRGNRTVLSAQLRNADGSLADEFEREVFFTTTPARAQILHEQSSLVANGRTRPVIAVRLVDASGRPIREGVSGEFTLSAPYETAAQVDNRQLEQLTRGRASTSRWRVSGADGVALIELAPTMVSGSAKLTFRFVDGDIAREQQLEAWIVPGDVEWTLIGLVEGSVGARSVADNMERAEDFESHFGDNARVAFYAKGRILGRFLTTVAYDSAKQREDQRVLGTLDPDAYYTVFADRSSRRFDAASRDNLYVRIEADRFFAQYGDFETGFDETQLARYNRTITGLSASARLGQVEVEGFAAEVGTRFRREEFQGQGISGPYPLAEQNIVPNSEAVFIEVRDRVRPEVVLERRSLAAFADYSIDRLAGTITFRRPVLSRSDALDPQFIVIEYEVDNLGAAEMTTGVRASWQNEAGTLRLGGSVISDEGDGPRIELGAIDVLAVINADTELRLEVAASRSDGRTANAWLVEAEHRSGSLIARAYAQSVDSEYGLDQQSAVDRGVRRIGVEGRALLTDNVSVAGRVWQADSLDDNSRRRAAEVSVLYTDESSDIEVGVVRFDDRLNDGSTNRSTLLEAAATQRLMDNRLELSAATSVPLEEVGSADLPARHRLGARYAVNEAVRVVGSYEVTDSEELSTGTVRGGVEITPWAGSQVTADLARQNDTGAGARTFAGYGIAQSLPVTEELTINAAIDGNITLDYADLDVAPIEPDRSAAFGGAFGEAALLAEDFTAVSLGATWRSDQWTVSGRGEYRDGRDVNRMLVSFDALRQLGEGSVLGGTLSMARADERGGATTTIFDAALALAHRRAGSPLAFLGKLEYRSDTVRDAIEGQAGPLGRALQNVAGDATSRRLIASLSATYAMRGGEGALSLAELGELGFFAAIRHNLDQIHGLDLSSTTVLGGLDGRVAINRRLAIGGRSTWRVSLSDSNAVYAYGPVVGINPTDDVLLTLGYNVSGFSDPDFVETRNTNDGFFLSVSAKIDSDILRGLLP